jgi:hypothetical protein
MTLQEQFREQYYYALQGIGIILNDLSRSLSDLGNRSEHDGRARTNGHDFEAHSGPTQRKIGDIWAALPAAQ